MANRSFLCNKEEKSDDHIFIHCDKTRVVWHLLFSLFGVSWMLPSLVRETLYSWHGSFMGRKTKTVWHITTLCLFWIVWKKRNSRAFDNEEHFDQGIKLIFLCNLWAWSKLFIALGPSIVDFVD